MASKLDEFDMKAPVADLLYPSVEKHNAMKKRAAALEKLPRAFVNNLELEKVADFITPHYQYRVMRLFCEVCDDEEVINYRLDILDDFIRLPSLSATIRKVINVMVENDRKNIYNLTTPDSFSQLDDAISGFDAYIQCMEIMHDFIYNLTTPDSFSQLDDAISGFDAYIQCMEIMHDFYGKMKDKIRSEGVKKLFAFFEEHYGDKHYISLKGEIEKLKKALYDRIRSVTVAINLDERLVPVSAGIIELSKERYDIKPSLVDRILYHGAKFNDKAVVKNLRKKYNDCEVSDDKLINTVDKTLFDELSDLTDTFVKMIDKVLAEYQKAGIADMRYIDYQLEYYMGAVAVIEACEDQGLKMCRPKILPAGERKAVIKDIFDPVYFREARIYNLDHKEKKSVVTNDITMGGDSEGFYVLTGANNGGKTTFLRAVGLCQIMAQTGLYVPASYCEISLVDYIYTQFPQEEKTGIDTSRFTTEIKEFREISDTITANSLLLMNESIQSTTPRECVEVACELLRIFCKMGVRGVFATHLVDIAYKTVELNKDSTLRTKLASIVADADDETGERKYKIVRGMPRDNSFAQTILKQYGIDMETIEKRIRENKA